MALLLQMACFINGYHRHQAPIVIRHYQALECRMSPTEQWRIGGAYAMRRGCDPTCWRFASDDEVNRDRMHRAAAPFRSRVGGLPTGPHHR